MLKWLGGGKSAHPLADEREAKATLDALRASEPFQAVEDGRPWIESVSAAGDLKPEKCLELVRQIEEALRMHQRKLAREYIFNAQLPKAQEARVWGALFGLNRDLSQAYARIVARLASEGGRSKGLPALAAVLAIQAASAQLKWHYLHYELSDPQAWEALVKSFRVAEERGATREQVAGREGPTTAERELLKALMLAASSPGCLLPKEIELGERLVAHLGAKFILSETHQPRVTYYRIDLAEAAPPRRLVETPAASPGMRFFAAGEAEADLDSLIKIAERGGVPSDLNLGDAWSGPTVLHVLRHLKTYWATTPPVRKHDRHAIQHRMNLVHDMAGVSASLEGAAAGGGVPVAAAEAWLSENISAGGMCLVYEGVRSERIRVGSIVGVRVEGGSSACSAGVIRRCNQLPQRKVSIAVSSLAKETFPVTLDGLAAPDALLLLNEGRHALNEVLVCLSENAYEPRISPTMKFNNATFLLTPIEVCERGEDFELVRYRALRQAEATAE